MDLTWSDYGKTYFNACGWTWDRCIPFNEETKHLLGTTDMPSEEFINCINDATDVLNGKEE